MIISHKYKFIFIKTNKTAGTSIEIALSRFCGENDVIAELNSEHEDARKNMGYRTCQNHLKRLSEYSFKDWRRTIRRRKWCGYSEHTPARDVVKYFGKDIWGEYYSFCFERNPWDRVVSAYYYHLKKSGKSESMISISDFIDSNSVKGLKKYGINNYMINGKIVVDRVCLYENLDGELEEVCSVIGLPEKPVLPRANANLRNDKLHYREMLSPSDRDKIAEIFKDEISMFGYEY